MKAEADLLAQLPASDARSRLAELVAADVGRYAETREWESATGERRLRRRLDAVRWGSQFLGIALGVLLLTRGEDIPDWWDPIFISVVFGGVFFPTLWLWRRERSRRS